MRLVDADKLIAEGWHLERSGRSNRTIATMSLADVPTAYDVDSLLEENHLLRAKINYMRLRGEGLNDY